MSHLHDFYRDVARVALAAAGPHRFVLGGGVAWAAHGLVTRPTEDVDLFADVEGAAAAAAAEVRAALELAGYAVVDADRAASWRSCSTASTGTSGTSW